MLVKTTSNGLVIAVHLETLAKQLAYERPSQVRAAAAAALNRSTQATVSEVVKVTAKNESLPRRFVKRRVVKPRSKRATPKFLSTQIRIYHAGVPWISIAKDGKGIFQAGRIKFKGRKGNKVLSVGTRTGGRRIERGFINNVNGRDHILAREGQKRLPITLPRVFIHKEANRQAKRLIPTKFRLEYEKNLEGVFRKKLSQLK